MNDVLSLLTMEEAAAVFQVSRRTFQDMLRSLPPGAWWIAAGRKKLFDASDIERIKEAMRCRSNSSRPVKGKRPTGRSGARTLGPTSTEALKLLIERKQAKSKKGSNKKSNVVSFPPPAGQPSRAP